MAVDLENIQVATCNSCGKREYSEDGTFGGLRGEVHAEVNGFGFVARWYSCSHAPGHIGKAVRAAVDAGPNENGAGDGQGN